MKDLSLWKETFKITHFFVNPDAQASIQGLSYCLQETAVNHAHAGEFGYEQLINENRAWVLTRQHIKLYKIPVISEKITIESWVHETKELFSVRDFHIFDTKNNLIGLARTSWMMLDLKSRRPVTIPKNLTENFPHQHNRIKEDLQLEKIPVIEDNTLPKTSFRVVYSELDVNHHVNNIHYSKWVLDDFDFDFRKKYRLESIENNFLSEALYGDKLEIVTIPVSDNPLVYITYITNPAKDMKILASRTKWVER